MPIYEFLDDQHESFMAQEQQPTRKGAIDMRVHACLYFIRPSGHRYSLYYWVFIQVLVIKYVYFVALRPSISRL